MPLARHVSGPHAPVVHAVEVPILEDGDVVIARSFPGGVELEHRPGEPGPVHAQGEAAAHALDQKVVDEGLQAGADLDGFGRRLVAASGQRRRRTKQQSSENDDYRSCSHELASRVEHCRRSGCPPPEGSNSLGRRASSTGDGFFIVLSALTSPWQKSSRHSTVPASRRDGVAIRAHTPGMHPNRALSGGAQERSRCSRDFHHGLLSRRWTSGRCHHGCWYNCVKVFTHHTVRMQTKICPD